MVTLQAALEQHLFDDKWVEGAGDARDLSWYAVDFVTPKSPDNDEVATAILEKIQDVVDADIKRSGSETVKEYYRAMSYIVKQRLLLNAIQKYNQPNTAEK